MELKQSGHSLNIDLSIKPLQALGIKRVLLMNAPTGLYMRDDRCQAPVEGMTAQPNRTPLDLAYMAAMLEQKGFACHIRDFAAEKTGWEEVEEELKSFKPDLVAMSVTTPTLEQDLITCTIAKRVLSRVWTVAKGAHFTPKDKEALLKFKDLDLAIRGESEHAIVEISEGKPFSQILGLTYRFHEELVHNEIRPFIDVVDLDQLPFPARHLLDNTLYAAPDTGRPITMIDAGRGCGFQCIYCAVSVASGYKFKSRSPQNVVDEIEDCVSKHQIFDFFFRADTFTWNEKWVLAFCQEIIARKLKIRWGCNSRVDTLSEERLKWMKKAGCWVVGFGMESGSQENLDRMKKRAKKEDAVKAVEMCNKFGIRSYGLFLIGLPWETRKMVEETIAFMKEVNPSFVDVNIAYPLPGTEFYEIAKKMNLFKEEDLNRGDYARPIVHTVELSTDELIQLRRKAILSFYLRPSYVLKTLFRIRSWVELKNYLGAGIRLLNNHALGFSK